VYSTMASLNITWETIWNYLSPASEPENIVRNVSNDLLTQKIDLF
jgi:hypothetical protein